jgi:L-threonylcarbamoyladenylate synthase
VSRIVGALGMSPPFAALEEAAEALRAGLVVGIPTDTVYGLAVEPSRPGATERLFELKGRPRSVALPVLVAGAAQALALAAPGPAARVLMQRWWPGALTLVMARRPSCWLGDLGGDENTIGLRCPAHPVPLGLAEMVGPLATTSANRHGGEPFETAQELWAELGSGLAVVLDAGPCSGSPSTVVDCTGSEPRCLREGGIGWAEVLASLERAAW